MTYARVGLGELLLGLVDDKLVTFLALHIGFDPSREKRKVSGYAMYLLLVMGLPIFDPVANSGLVAKPGTSR